MGKRSTTHLPILRESFTPRSRARSPQRELPRRRVPEAQRLRHVRRQGRSLSLAIAVFGAEVGRFVPLGHVETVLVLQQVDRVLVGLFPVAVGDGVAAAGDVGLVEHHAVRVAVAHVDELFGCQSFVP